MASSQTERKGNDMTNNKRITIALLLAGCAFVGVATIVGCASQNTTDPIVSIRDLFPAAQSLRDVTFPQAMEQRISFLAIEGPSGTVGYIAEQQLVPTRSGSFTLKVVMDDHFRIRNARALEYTAQRGEDICTPSFARQFEGKTPDAPIRVGTDIDAITGATISSRAMADGVRRIIRLARDEFSGTTSSR